LITDYEFEKQKHQSLDDSESEEIYDKVEIKELENLAISGFIFSAPRLNFDEMSNQEICTFL
jgi:hypothetical protein